MSMIDTAELVVWLFILGILATAVASYSYELVRHLIHGDDATAFSRPGATCLNFVIRPLNWPGIIALGYVVRFATRIIP